MRIRMIVICNTDDIFLNILIFMFLLLLLYFLWENHLDMEKSKFFEFDKKYKK